MKIGNSNITKKQWKQYVAEFAALSKEERIVWLSNGEPDAMLLSDIKTGESFWVPMINHVRFCNGEEVYRLETRGEALTKAVEILKEYKEKVSA